MGGAEYVMFDWLPERRTRLHIVPLAGGATRVFDAPAYFTFHYINAFETADGRSLCFGARPGPASGQLCRRAALQATQRGQIDVIAAPRRLPLVSAP